MSTIDINLGTKHNIKFLQLMMQSPLQFKETFSYLVINHIFEENLFRIFKYSLLSFVSACLIAIHFVVADEYLGPVITLL